MERDIHRPLIVATTVGVLLLVATATRWWLVDWLAPFLFLPVQGAIWLCFFAVVIWLATFAARRRGLGRVAYLPLLVCIVTFVLAALVPFDDLWLKLNFAWYKSEREDVVRRVLSGSLYPNVSYNGSLIALGQEQSNVSMGGNEIVVETHNSHTYIFFFTYRGILRHYSGFVFVTDGGDPREFSDLYEVKSTHLTQLGGPWYYASHS